MNVPEKLEVPVVVKDKDGNEHEVERFIYRLERNSKSRWAELFSTPERAAETLATCCYDSTSYACDTCVFANCDGTLRNSAVFQTVSDKILEWLRDDA